MDDPFALSFFKKRSMLVAGMDGVQGVSKCRDGRVGGREAGWVGNDGHGPDLTPEMGSEVRFPVT